MKKYKVERGGMTYTLRMDDAYRDRHFPDAVAVEAAEPVEPEPVAGPVRKPRGRPRKAPAPEAGADG